MSNERMSKFQPSVSNCNHGNTPTSVHDSVTHTQLCSQYNYGMYACETQTVHCLIQHYDRAVTHPDITTSRQAMTEQSHVQV